MKTDITVNGFIFYKDKVLLIYHETYKMWIGVGGHLDENETPDSQLLKEIKEETNLNARIIGVNDQLKMKILNNVIRICPTPLHPDLHKVKDHWHYAQYYVCTVNDISLFKPEENEYKKYQWLTFEEVENNSEIQSNTKQILKAAFNLYKNEKNN